MAKFAWISDSDIIDLDKVYSIHEVDGGIRVNFDKGTYIVIEGGTMEAVHKMIKDVYSSA